MEPKKSHKKAWGKCAGCDNYFGSDRPVRHTHEIGPICTMCFKRINRGGNLYTGEPHKEHKKNEIMKELQKHINKTEHLPGIMCQFPDTERGKWGDTVRRFFNMGIYNLSISPEFERFKGGY